MRVSIGCLLVSVCVFGSPFDAQAQTFDWEPQPEKAALLVVSAHPDDEGIFFGGTLPYYTQVRDLDTVHISMTSGDYLASNGPPGWRREQELRAADWVYGFRNEPLFPRFRDFPTATVEQTFDIWADGVINGDDADEGRLAAAMYVAEQIRRYQPEIIMGHDFEGEYGHVNHQASAIATADAWDLAINPTIDIAGLPAWQPKKLYLHQSQANGLGSPGETFVSWLFHDYLEEISIDTNGDLLADSSPRQVADLGLEEHMSQGQPDVSTVYRTGENFDGHHSEWWGLYRSTVGPDTAVPTFMIAGYEYEGWARGDFFENVFNPPIFTGDVNQDGVVSGDGTGPAESDDITALILGWGTMGHATPLERIMHGDLNLDGRTNLADWHILRINHPDGGLPDFAARFANRPSVPEPSSAAMLLTVAALLLHFHFRGKVSSGTGRPMT